MIKGVDVARYQLLIDWATLAKSIDFAYIKATDGLGQDPMYVRNWTEARKQNVPVGAYHFLRPGNGVAQAQHFLNTMVERTGDGILPPTVDVEWSPRRIPKSADTWQEVSLAARVQTVTAFLTTIESAINLKPIIYTARSWWDPMMGASPVAGNIRFADYHLWIANYGGQPTPLPRAWQNWSIWQSSGHGHMPGIDAEVDLDSLNPNMTVADLLQPPSQSSNPTGQPLPVTPPVIRLRTPFMRGPAVLALQNALVKLGLMPADQADGIFGPGTEGIVKQFQQSKGLGVDGIVGPNTWAAINQD